MPAEISCIRGEGDRMSARLSSDVGLEVAPPQMHRLASVHVEDPMRSLNRWFVRLSALTRHHRARAAMACPITGDERDGTACRDVLPTARIDGAVMRVGLCAGQSGMGAQAPCPFA